MQVPVRRQPSTRVSGQQLGYEDAARGIDYSPITEQVREFAKQLETREDEMDEFELNNRLIQETNELQGDFQNRQSQAPLGAAGFTEQVLGDYETRHNDLLTEYADRGFNREAIQNFSLRLGSLRENFGQRALAFQADSVGALADSELQSLDRNLSQLVTNNYDAYASSLEESRNAWDNFPGLTAQQREAGFERSRRVLAESAGRGMATFHPDVVIEALDPTGLTAPKSPATATQGAYANVTGWQSVATNVGSALGLDPVEVAAVMSFETAGTLDPTIEGGDGGNYLGLIQFGRNEQAQYGITKDSSPEDWTNAILGFMGDRGFTQGMGIEDFYSTILTGRPGNYTATDSNGTNVANAIPRILSEHRDNAERWLHLAQVDVAPSEAEQAPEVVTPQQIAQTIAEAQTGNPVLDALTGTERLQILAMARERRGQEDSTMRASLDVVVNNAVAAVGNGRYAGPVPPKEQFIQAYGAIAGEQQWARFNGSVQAAQTFQSIKNLGRAQLEQAIEAYKPDPTKETFAQDTQIYNALREAAQRTLTARADDPAKYIFSEYPEIRNAYEAADTPEDQRAVYAQMERTFERLGIPEGERFYMTEEQLRSVGQQYKNAEPEGKIAMLRQFTETMGARAGRTLGRFGGAEDVAQDFALSSMLRQMPGGDTTLLRVFEGRDAMAKDPARRPTPSTVQGEFRRLVGDGTIRNLDGDMSRMLREAATGIYVARGGNVDGGNLTDQTLFRESLREALGGVSGNANTGWFTSGGVTTILPPQVTRAQFENWAEGLDLADYTRYSGGHRIVDGRGRTVPVTDIIDDGRFVLVAVDTYGVVFSDGRLAQNERGQPFTMHVQLRPPRADAQRPATRRPVPNATSMR